MREIRSEIVDIFNHAVEAVYPGKLVENAVRVVDSSLVVTSLAGYDGTDAVQLDLKNTRIHVIGGGKSALSMALGLAKVAEQNDISHQFWGGALSLPVELRSKPETASQEQLLLDTLDVKCLYGSRNNLPDSGSATASREILDIVEATCIDDYEKGRNSLFIVLISGGSSSCLTSPSATINLIQKRRLLRRLIQKGADIVELNKVRRYFSNIKGGKLAKHILRHNQKARIVSLILSDVVRDPIEFIGGGPTYLLQPESHKKQMIEILQKYKIHLQGINEFAKASAKRARTSRSNSDSSSSSDEGDDEDDNDDEDLYNVDIRRYRQVHNCIIGNNKMAIDAAIKRAEQLNYQVFSMGNQLHGYTEFIMKKIVNRCDLERRLRPTGKLLVIGGGETLVKRQSDESWGTGGRAQEMVLDYMLNISDGFGLSPESDYDLFLAAGTDGQDGPTDAAGCLASMKEIRKIREDKHLDMKLLLNAEIAKNEHNAHDFWMSEYPDWLMKTGLTGTSVMDLYIYALIDVASVPKAVTKMETSDTVTPVAPKTRTEIVNIKHDPL